MSVVPPPATNSPVDAQWTRTTLALLTAIVGIGLVLGWLSRGAVTPIYGDASIYVALARSISHGHFQDDYLVGSPPHAQYPPGMPIWIFLIHLVAGDALDPTLAGNLLLFALVVLMIADALRRLASPSLGVAAAAIIVFNPPLIALTGQLRSEIVFLFFCTAALWLSLLHDLQRRRLYPTLIITSTLLAFLTRSAGLALIPAILWAFLLRRQWKPLLAGGVLSGITALSWFGYTRWAAPQTVARTYAVDFAAATPVNQPLRFLAHAASNGQFYFAQLASRQFGIPDIHGQPLDNLLFGMLLLIPAGVGMYQLRRRWPAMVTFVILSGVMMLAFPWPLGRLLTILVPWLVLTMLLGWSAIARHFFPNRAGRLTLAIGVVLAGVGLISGAKTAVRTSGCRALPAFQDPQCYNNEDRAYAQAVRFIRDSLSGEGGVGASKPASVYLLTGRQTLPLELFGSTNPEKLLKPEGPLLVVLLARLLPFEYDVVAPRLLADCNELTLRRSYASGTLLLQRRSGNSPDACAAITEYIRTTPVDLDRDGS